MPPLFGEKSIKIHIKIEHCFFIDFYQFGDLFLDVFGTLFATIFNTKNDSQNHSLSGRCLTMFEPFSRHFRAIFVFCLSVFLVVAIVCERPKALIHLSYEQDPNYAGGTLGGNPRSQ